MNDTQRQELLQIARKTVEAEVTGRPRPVLPETESAAEDLNYLATK